MWMCIGSVLSAEAVAQVRQLLAGQSFVDGQTTAGWAARGVKRNEQLDPGSPNYAQLQTTVMQALAANDVFMMAALPRAFRPVLFSAYGDGMEYGNHVDNAIMGEQPYLRSDLSFTLFLSEPSDYEGGELTVDELGETRSFKLPAGALVLYSSTTLHRVERVRSGRRLVAVGWLQSLIREDARRQMHFELETVRRSLFQQGGKTPEFDALSKCASNLLRMWADT